MPITWLKSYRNDMLDFAGNTASLANTLPTQNWIVAGFDLTTCVLGIALLHTAWKVSRHCGRLKPAPCQQAVAIHAETVE